MTQLEDGQVVNVHYRGRLEDGTVFDSSEGREPLEFTLGANQVIVGFEAAVRALSIGETSETTIPPEKAYGERKPDLIMQIPPNQFPPDMSPEVGMQIGLQSPQGQAIPAMIVAVDRDAVTIDANSPLAGKTLIFELTLVSVS